jgi:methyl-accepting chemotaxis protein
MSIRKRVQLMLLISLAGMIVLLAFIGLFLWQNTKMEAEKERVQKTFVASNNLQSSFNEVRKLEQAKPCLKTNCINLFKISSR